MPLLVHSQRAMNLLDKRAEELQSLTKKDKTPAILKQISDLEMELGLYYNTEIGPYVPAPNVRKCLHDGSKKGKKGAKFLEAVRTHPDTQKFPIVYEGERDLGWLLEQVDFRDVRTVKVGKAVVPRTRPIFHDWKLQGYFIVDESVLKFNEFVKAGEEAGKGVGLGDFTPKRTGEYGTFNFYAEEVKG